MTKEVVAKVASMSEVAFSKAMEYVQATEGFVVEQAPILIQEILNWGLAESSIYCVIWGVFGSALLYGVYRACRAPHDDNDECVLIPVVIFGGGGGILAVIASFCYLLEAVKVLVAPRLYLLEQLKTLI